MNSIAAKPRLATLLASATLAAALSSNASAQPGPNNATQRFYVNPDTGFATPLPTAHQNAPGANQKFYVNPDTGFAYPEQGLEATTEMGSPQPTVQPPSPAGFDWPSAAIGAAAGGLLLLLTSATIGVARRRRGAPAGRDALRG